MPIFVIFSRGWVHWTPEGAENAKMGIDRVPPSANRLEASPSHQPPRNNSNKPHKGNAKVQYKDRCLGTSDLCIKNQPRRSPNVIVRSY